MSMGYNNTSDTSLTYIRPLKHKACTVKWIYFVKQKINVIIVTSIVLKVTASAVTHTKKIAA